MEAFGRPFLLDWQEEGLTCIYQVILKKYNAEIHSQAAIEGALALRREHGFTGEQVERVEIRIFEVAYNIIGGGNEGEKQTVTTKEEADHSLPYLVAVALLDGQVGPEQYTPERIRREDVQQLLRRILVQPWPDYSRGFPAEMRCRLAIRLAGGRELIREQGNYEGFHTDPMSWETAERKFESLSQPFTSQALRQRIIEAIRGLESVQVSEVTRLLAQVRAPEEEE